MENTNLQKRKFKFEYKWVIAALSFLMVMTTLGFCSSSKDIYLKAITSALGIKRALFSFNDVCRYLSTAVLNLFFGALVMKFGPKKLMLAGFASLIISCLIYSVADSIYVFYIGGCFLGIGLSWCTTNIVGYVVGKWFTKNKGTVMGVILASNGIGSTIAMQVFVPIIDSGTFGYRMAYRAIAITLVAVAVLIALFFKEKPKDYVETLSAAPGKKKPARGQSWEGIAYATVKRKPYFWMTLAGVFLTGFCLQSVLGVKTAHLEDVGLKAFKATVGSFYSMSIVATKILCGVSYDKLGLRKTLVINYVCGVLSVVMLAFLGLTGLSSQLIYAVAANMILALAIPLETIMIPLIANDLFGEKDYAKILGILLAVSVAGYAAGTPLINLVYDITHTYKWALIAVAAILAAILINLMIATKLAKKDKDKVLAGEPV